MIPKAVGCHSVPYPSWNEITNFCLQGRDWGSAASSGDWGNWLSFQTSTHPRIGYKNAAGRVPRVGKIGTGRAGRSWRRDAPAGDLRQCAWRSSVGLCIWRLPAACCIQHPVDSKPGTQKQLDLAPVPEHHNMNACIQNK